MLRDAPRRLFALVDCSNFYVACERLFRPDLASTPIAVLSNNDGCVVARSQEVKRMGVAMGAPFFEVREKLEANGVEVFSSNYELYADLSRRVMDTLSTFTPDVEIYSIDEAFLSLSTPRPEHRDHDRLTALAHEIRAKVMRWTGIPVRVSIAETKTLAKIGSEYAKVLRKRGHAPCASLYGMSADERDLILRTTAIRDVWGVGRSYGRKLPLAGITTAAGLRDADDGWIRKTMRVTGLRTALELRGVSCIPFEKVPLARKSMVRSRSFSRPVTEVEEMKEAVATHAARACEKLRAEGLAARAVQVFFNTGHSDAKGPHRSAALAADLPRATNITPEVLRLTARLVEAIWQDGDGHQAYRYKKAGVMMLDLTRADPAQGHLFLPERPELARAMEALDRVNQRFGKRTVVHGAEGTRRHHDTETGQDGAMPRRLRSPAYTTRWEDLVTLHAR
jgi:DNA polymerase V